MSIINPTPVDPTPAPRPAPGPGGVPRLVVRASAACDTALPGVAPANIWQQIIAAVLSIFGSCMAPASPAEAQADAAAAYQPNGHYDPGTLRIAARHARRAAEKSGTRLSKEESFTAAPIILDHIRTAEPADMQEAFTACMGS